MTKVLAGHTAPTFTLSGLDGQRFALTDVLKKGPVVAAFLKVSCPVCQFTFPFLERLYAFYRDERVTFWAISQDDATDTKEFCADLGVTFPPLLDEDGYPVSNLYGLTNVPTILLIAPDGKVRVSCMGFGKAELEEISGKLAEYLGKSPAPVFRTGEVVPEYKPG